MKGVGVCFVQVRSDCIAALRDDDDDATTFHHGNNFDFFLIVILEYREKSIQYLL
jgi:hypothetical protein